MEVRLLDAFVAVAEELHFGRAAERLHVAQSPLSQMIRKLERELGCPLLVRSTRNVALTPSGAALLPHAYRITQELKVARQAANAAAGGITGHIRFGYSGVLNQRLLPPLTRAAHEQHPELKLKLVQTFTRRAAVDLQSARLDCAFVGFPADLPVSLRTRPVARSVLAALLPVGHPHAGDREVALADLSSDAFITFPKELGSALTYATVQGCMRSGFEPRGEQEIADPYMLISLVSAGVGVALVPGEIAEVVPPGAVLVPLKGEPVYLDHALAWVDDNVSTSLRVFLEIAEKVLPTPAEMIPLAAAEPSSNGLRGDRRPDQVWSSLS